MTDETPAPPPPPPGPYVPPAGPTGGDEPWAARLGLVRPRHGRLVAGVCASIGRATNTDPLLWRVLFGVLAVFGIGIALYLGVWLFTPAEGDTASPVESLIGRGHSSTSTGLTIALVVFTIVCIGALTDNWIVPVVAIVAVTVVILANPRARNWNASPATVPAPEPVTEPIPAAQTSYQPPFAPHGPYAPSTPPQPVTPPRPPKVKRERSRLGRFIMGVALLAVGIMGIADLAGASVPAPAYVAAALFIIGLGLIVGTWFGRARSLIFIGIVLSLAAPIVEHDMSDESQPGMEPIFWVPATVAEVNDVYDNRFGEATLDLSNVDFTGQQKVIQVEVGGGTLRVILPYNVDALVNANVRLGHAEVFGQDIGGVNQRNSWRDLGKDGEGGGNVEIQLVVRAGDASVTR